MITATIMLNERQVMLLKELFAHANEIQGALEHRRYLWSSDSGHVELEIEPRHIDAIAQPGDNEAACRAAIDSDGYLRYQLQGMDMEEARVHLTEAGIDEVDEMTEEMVIIHILWSACHDISDERNMEDL